jgi:hypothetical protein
MESQNSNTPIPGSVKLLTAQEVLKFGIALAVLIVVTYAMWIGMNDERDRKDKQFADSMAQMRRDIDILKRDNKECNEFTKSILLKEIQESNTLQKDLYDWLNKHSK